jgi:ribosome-associated protein
MLIILHHFRIPQQEFRFSFVRSSGPGGQNVNKLNTKAVLRWTVSSTRSLPEDARRRFMQRYATHLTGEGELILTSQRFRDQRQNRRDCLEKLREMLVAIAVAPKKRRPTKPTRASTERRHQKKQRHAAKKQRRRTSGWEE